MSPMRYMMMNLFTTGFIFSFPELYKTVLAQRNYDVRLVGGLNATEGRVEIYYSSQWGTICDDDWGVQESMVVCRQLGYERYSETLAKAAFGRGTGMIWLDDVSCTGIETALWSCSHRTWGSSNCDHGEDVGVRCQAESEGSLRVSGGKTANEGRLEIYHEGEWGTVCFNYWDMPDGLVACRQLGYPGVEMVGLPFGQGTGRIWMDKVLCTGTEQRLAECLHGGWGNHDCDHSDDAGVSCALFPAFDGALKLVGGAIESEGRIELFHNREWGTVCDDGWDMYDGAVACRQLGYPGVDSVYHAAAFGQGLGRIWRDDTLCSGTELMLADCPHAGYSHNCDHAEDAGVRCTLSSDEVTLRLVNGPSDKEGRIEVYHDNQWGTVCDIGWDNLDSQVVCRQLGFTDFGGYFIAADRGYGVSAMSTRPVHLNMVDCVGDEDRLEYCIHSSWGVNDCSHSSDVGVQCYVKGKGLSVGEIVGIVIGSLVGVLLFFLCYIRGRKKKPQLPQHTAVPMEDVSGEGAVAVDDVRVSRGGTPELDNIHPEVTVASQPPPSYNDITKYKSLGSEGIHPQEAQHPQQPYPSTSPPYPQSHPLPSAPYPPPSFSGASVMYPYPSGDPGVVPSAPPQFPPNSSIHPPRKCTSL